MTTAGKPLDDSKRLELAESDALAVARERATAAAREWRDAQAGVAEQDEGDAPDVVAMAEELLARTTLLVGEIEDLPSRQRQVMWLLYVEGRSTEEIAGLLGFSPRTVRADARAATEALKAHLASSEERPVAENTPENEVS